METISRRTTQKAGRRERAKAEWESLQARAAGLHKAALEARAEAESISPGKAERLAFLLRAGDLQAYADAMAAWKGDCPIFALSADLDDLCLTISERAGRAAAEAFLLGTRAGGRQ